MPTAQPLLTPKPHPRCRVGFSLLRASARLPLTAILLLTLPAQAQRRGLDWSFYAGDAQRTGWEKTDSSITKENVKDFKLVLKDKLETGQTGPRSLTPPVVLGNLISYKGFKELGFVAGSSGDIWSIDVDTDRLFWHKNLESDGKATPGCPATVTAVPSLTPPTNFARPRPPRTVAGGAPAPVNAAPAPTPRPAGILGTNAFGSPRPAFALSSDGKLHILNTSNGDDLVTPIPFIPAHAVASSLTIADGYIYTTTDSSCGGTPAAVWSLDLSSIDPKNPSAPAPKVASYKTPGNISSLGGAAFGSDGTVYVQSSDGTLSALTPKELKLESSFATKYASKGNLATPVLFTHKDHELIVTAGADGALYLLDAQKLDTPLSKTPALTNSGQGIWGGLSSWQDPAGTRWVLASVWGAINPDLKLDAKAPHGSVIAFKVDDQNGKLALTPAWASRDMASPQPTGITNGVVFALATQPHATLYALDALTGKELYTTGNQVTNPGNQTGITVANGRVYFTTTDGTLYAFGIFLER